MRDLRLSAEVIRYGASAGCWIGRDGAGRLAGRDRWWVRAGVAALCAGPARPGAGHHGTAHRFAERDRGGDLQGQVVRLLAEPLDNFVAEDQAVLRAGLSDRGLDDGGRHRCPARVPGGFTTQIGDNRFTVFRTGTAKSRETFLSLLRAGHTDYVVNAAALDYRRGRSLSGQVVAQLDAHPAKRFADTSAWSAHLARLGTNQLAVTPNPVRIASEGALWGAVCHHGLLTRDGDRVRRRRPVPGGHPRTVLGAC